MNIEQTLKDLMALMDARRLIEDERTKQGINEELTEWLQEINNEDMERMANLIQFSRTEEGRHLASEYFHLDLLMLLNEELKMRDETEMESE